MLGGLAGAAAAAGLSVGPAVATAATGTRRFSLSRGGSEIGFHTLAVSQQGDVLRMEIDILIEVRVLGIRAYVYEHKNIEQWRDGALVALDSTTNDDGTPQSVTVRREGDQLRIQGSEFSGSAPASAVPTSYWNYANFQSASWFSSQSGKLLNLTFAESQRGGRLFWTLGGDFATELEYDTDGEWRGCRFDARGTDIVYAETAPGPAFNPLV